MQIDTEQKRRLIEAIVGTIQAHADHLTQLDRDIGDGDHGINLRRGMQAIADDIDEISAKPLPEALKAMGTKLVMSVGGAAGPLFGTLFMSLGKGFDNDQPSRADLSAALAGAVEAVKARGKSEAGQKTMLDVLVPLADLLSRSDGLTLDQVAGAVDQAADNTIPMLALKGRASFLGERSIGHMDPGACSTALITRAICDCAGKLS